jgi:hypothetical protein
MSAVRKPTNVKPATNEDTRTSDTKPTAEYTRSDGVIYVKLPGMTHAAQVAMDPDTHKPVFRDKEIEEVFKKKLAAWDTMEKVENRSLLLA